MEVAKKVLEALSANSGVDFDFREGQVGLTALEKTGSILPEDTISLCKSVDAVLLGGLSGKILENDVSVVEGAKCGVMSFASHNFSGPYNQLLCVTQMSIGD